MTKRGETARSTKLGGKRQDTRGRIVEAARHVFQDRGYERATIGDIVGAARLSRASFYLYFAGKPEVYQAVGASYGEQMAARFAALDVALATPGRDAFRAWVEAQLRWMGQSRQSYVAWGELERQEPEVSAQIWRATITTWLGEMPVFRDQWPARSAEPFARLGLFVGQLQFFHHPVLSQSERRIVLDVLTDTWLDQLVRHPAKA